MQKRTKCFVRNVTATNKKRKQIKREGSIPATEKTYNLM